MQNDQTNHSRATNSTQAITALVVKWQLADSHLGPCTKHQNKKTFPRLHAKINPDLLKSILI